MPITRRGMLVGGASVAAALALPATAARASVINPTDSVLCTDYAVDPHGDPDDQYDVACWKTLGGTRVVLDNPTPQAVAKLAEIGMYAVVPETIRETAWVAVVGSCRNAWANYRYGQRVIVFAGDALDGHPETNEQLDPYAYERLVAQPNTWRVPCFQGGWPNSGPRASVTETSDDTLTSGLQIRSWLRSQFADVWGYRRIYAGALLNLVRMPEWQGHGFGPDRVFVAGPNFPSDMVGGTRWLLQWA